jgi:hypothetical protein
MNKFFFVKSKFSALLLVLLFSFSSCVTNKDLEYATELLLKQRGRTIKDMERNNLIIPKIEDEEGEEYYEEFYQ